MKTLLVPYDFTEATDSALKYSISFCKQFEYNRIVLLKSFYDTVFDDVVMAGGYSCMVDSEFRLKEHEQTEKQLKTICKNFSSQNKAIEVTAMTSELPLMLAIADAIDTENPTTIVVASNHKLVNLDSYVGMHVAEIVRSVPLNVLVVPAGKSYETIEEIIIPIDKFTKDALEKIDELRRLPYLRKMKIQVLKSDPVYAQESDVLMHEHMQIHKWLNHYRHEIHYTNETNVNDALKHFVKKHPAHLIIALPGKYSFLYRLTHKLISQVIYQNSEKPVLIMKEFEIG